MSAVPRRVGWVIAIAAMVSLLGVAALVLWRWLPRWAPYWVVEHSPWMEPALRAARSDTYGGQVRTRCRERLLGEWQPVAARVLGTAMDDPNLRNVAIDMLANWAPMSKNPDPVRLLIGVIDSDPDQKNRIRAIAGLGNSPEAPVCAVLIRATRDLDANVRSVALFALGPYQREPSVVDADIVGLRDVAPRVREAAAYCLRFSIDKRALKPLLAILDDPDPGVLIKAIEALDLLHDERAAEPLLPLLDHEADGVAKAAFIALWNLPAELPGVSRRMARLGRVPVKTVLAWDEVKDYMLGKQALVWGADDLADLCQSLEHGTDAVRVRAARVLAAMMTNGKTEHEWGWGFFRLDDYDHQERDRLLASAQHRNINLVDVLVTAAGTNQQSGVRCNAFFALRWLDDERVRHVAVAALEPVESADVRLAAAMTLATLHDDRALVPLLAKKQADFNEVSEVIDALGEIGDQRAIGPILAILAGRSDESDRETKWHAAHALGQLGDLSAIAPLIRTLQDPDLTVRAAVAHALAELGDWRAVQPLVDRLALERGWETRCALVEALGVLGDPRAVPALIPLVEDPDDGFRIRVIWALGLLRDPRAIPVLIAHLGDDNGPRVMRAAWSLAQIGGPTVIEPLLALLDHPYIGVVEQVTALLATLPLTPEQQSRLCSPSLSAPSSP